MNNTKHSPQSFMKLIDGQKGVFELNLAGAHDCVANFVQFSRMARCQSRDIFSLLKMGVRGLDIRVQSRGDRLVMVHGRAKVYSNRLRLGGQMDLSLVLADCYRFLEGSPSECVIFQFKNDDRKEMEKCFDNLFNMYIKKNPKAWFVENREPSLDEARGKIVLLRRCDMAEREEYTDKNTGVDFSRWVEQDDAVNEPLYLETGGRHSVTFFIQDRYSYAPKPRWDEVIKPFLDNCGEFDGVHKINYLSTAGGTAGPRGNANYINPKFLVYPLKRGVHYGMLYCDFPPQELIDKIIETNFEV